MLKLIQSFDRFWEARDTRDAALRRHAEILSHIEARQVSET